MSDIDFQNGFICGMATKGLIKTVSQGSEGKRVARVTIGTTQNGWTAEEVDYLCDGTDDQEEIIQALNDLPETGGEVVILDGTYNITASINMPKDNVSIRGSGDATILKRMYNSTNTYSGPTARGLIHLAEKSGCKIQGLQIDGNKAAYTTNYNCGIYLALSNNNTVTGNICTDSSNCGIYVDSSSINTITGNICTGSSSGIDLNGSSINIIMGNICTNNTIGIYLYGSSDNNTVRDNTCPNNNVGISLHSSNNDNTVTGNTCNNNSTSGIYLDGSSNNTVTGNTCNNNDIGIWLYSSNDNTITGNTCSNNDYGIDLYRSRNNTITNNTCTDSSNCGIYLYYSSNNNTITGNTCIRGTGTPEDYTTNQYTIRLSGTDNDYNLISFNNCMGKAVVIEGGTDNSAWGNQI